MPVIDSNIKELKGQILYPCCPKEKAMVGKTCHGKASYKCPRCGKFVLFDFDRMKAYPITAMRSASQRFKIK